MVVRRSWLIVLAPLCLVAVLGFAVFAQPMGPMGQYPSSLLSGLRWRDRSEERRVGKEGRFRGAPDHLKKKKKEEMQWREGPEPISSDHVLVRYAREVGDYFVNLAIFDWLKQAQIRTEMCFFFQAEDGIRDA